ncbi:hypothetical protein NECAME_14101 [Necator americanus]|uniref:Uncharacterized protein n=1 Tax=Necator americanus TaxID=51031 RepID=W2SQ79_NECAM|nr:hypothetical protein NECAME_14101 [Necator americanus]ETN71770.1 hypothetical protein NECAME_14101 [Necator americanus]
MELHVHHGPRDDHQLKEGPINQYYGPLREDIVSINPCHRAQRAWKETMDMASSYKLLIMSGPSEIVHLQPSLLFIVSHTSFD